MGRRQNSTFMSDHGGLTVAEVSDTLGLGRCSRPSSGERQGHGGEGDHYVYTSEDEALFCKLQHLSGLAFLCRSNLRMHSVCQKIEDVAQPGHDARAVPVIQLLEFSDGPSPGGASSVSRRRTVCASVRIEPLRAADGLPLRSQSVGRRPVELKRGAARVV